MNQENAAAATSVETQVNSISERKREANRRNAKHSTGPKTGAGKRRSRYNAIKHGFFAREMPLQCWIFTEDFGKAERLFQELVDHFQPVGPVEKTVVEMIAECCWKMRRLQIAETASIKVAIDGEKDSIRRNQGERESRYLLIDKVFDEAQETAEKLGYVDDVLTKAVLQESGYDAYFHNKFLLANQKARDLVTQRADGSNLGGHEARKKAQSALRRSLHALRESAWKWEKVHEETENRQTEPHYAQHFLPSADVADNLLRYQGSVERRFYRALDRLEHLQRMRLGEAYSSSTRLTT